MPKEIRIAGAGLAGLVAGINLAREGYRVQIMEARPRIGGDMRYADSTLMDPEALKSFSGIDIRQALEPWTHTRVWAYGKKYEFPMPGRVPAFSFERGCAEMSLDNLLCRQALEAGVEIEFGRRLGKEELRELPPGSIIATGLNREAFEALDIPSRPFFAHMGTGEAAPDRPGVIVYFDEFTREYGYYFQSQQGSAGALVFSMHRTLVDSEKAAFRQALAKNDGIELDNWNDGIAGWGAWPMVNPRNLRLRQGDKLLAGTVAGAISPVLLFGVNGALVSGKIAALAVTDPDLARKEFRRLAPLYYPQWAFRKLREYAPHAVLKPLIQTVLATYDPALFPWMMMFALWPPGMKGK